MAVTGRRAAWVTLAAVVLVAGAIVVVVWAGRHPGPMCPRGESWVLMPVGKVLAPECV